MYHTLISDFYHNVYCFNFISTVHSHFHIPAIFDFFCSFDIGNAGIYITLGLRASQIEEILDIIGEPTIQFEASVGIFGSAAGDVLTTQVGKYWLMFALLVIVVGIAPIIIGLIYAFIEFYRDVGYSAWCVTSRVSHLVPIIFTEVQRLKYFVIANSDYNCLFTSPICLH
jgi:hypothetical protein